MGSISIGWISVRLMATPIKPEMRYNIQIYTKLLMQKTRSILFLREILDQLELEEDTDIAHSASFRHKDLELLTQECHDKYSKLAALVAEKQKLDHRLLELKEQLCELNPEALEQIERDCEQKNNGHNQDIHTGRQKGQGLASKTIKKKNDKKRRRKERLYYD